jgi:hypothetical protein
MKQAVIQAQHHHFDTIMSIKKTLLQTVCQLFNTIEDK